MTTPDGRERTYRLYVPPDLPTGEPVPLLVALHGAFGWSTQFELNSGFDGLADANHFIVVYPDGIGIPITDQGEVWNAGGCCGPAQDDKQGVDDVGFIVALVHQIEATQPVDPGRVYAAGHSNGAMMSYRLACEAADTFAAIAVQSGTLFVDDCAPARPIPVLEIHGTADRNVPLDGGAGDNVVASYVFPSTIDGLQHLALLDGCAGPPVTTSDPANPDVSFQTWSPCAGGAVVELARIDGASHAWMGHPSPSPRLDAMAGTPYQGFDSSAAIWSFLAARSMG